MKLFLDVDGVLLAGDRLAPHAIEFLTFATESFECAWLTTHVREHDTEQVHRHLLQATPQRLKSPLSDLVQKVRPAPWDRWKTDALPRGGNFVWLDDSPTASEIAWLRQRGWLAKWLHVDVCDEPDDLLRAERLLRRWLT